VLKKLEIEDEKSAMASAFSSSPSSSSSSSSTLSTSSSSSSAVYVASPLHRLALHIEVSTLSVLALLTARVRDARRRRAIKLVAFHNHVAKVCQTSLDMIICTEYLCVFSARMYSFLKIPMRNF
jgi:flagellar capping protein FliD